MPGEVYGFESGTARRWAELINRVFGLESSDAPLPPGFLLEVDRPEWAIHKRERLWTTGQLPIAAAVGNFSRMQIINPPKSGLLVVVTGIGQIAAASGVTTDISGDGARIVAGVIQNTCRDNRVPLNGAGTARPVGSQNAVANNLPATSGINLERISSPAPAGINTDIYARTVPFIMGPDTNVEITQRVANQAAVFIAWGYERPLNPDELAA